MQTRYYIYDAIALNCISFLFLEKKIKIIFILCKSVCLFVCMNQNAFDKKKFHFSIFVSCFFIDLEIVIVNSSIEQLFSLRIKLKMNIHSMGISFKIKYNSFAYQSIYGMICLCSNNWNRNSIERNSENNKHKITFPKRLKKI